MTVDGSLRASHVSKWFGQQQALSDVTVALRSGEVHALVGHNGAGKSTLLRTLAGVVAPDDGTVELDGAPVLLTPRGALERGIVTVYQELRVIGELTVAENVFLGREIRTRGQLARGAMRRRTRALLDEYRIAATPDTRTASLPVAQQQMLEVATGLDRGARFLLLDEPTTALEADQIEHLIAVIRRAAASGVAVAIVNHKLDEVFAVADRVSALADGRLVLGGAVADLRREQVVQAIIGEEETHDPAVPASAARPAPVVVASDAPPLLRARDVVTDAVGPVSLDLPAGQVTALYGLVGSGRTEFVRALMGIDRQRGGRLEIDGRPFRPRSPAEAVAAGLTCVSEDRKGEGLIPEMDSIANVSLSVLGRFRRWGLLRRRQIKERSNAMLDVVRLQGRPDVSIRSLSGGNQQKVLLGRALFSNPRLVILDEPTKGVDIGAKAEIHQMITALAHDEGAGVLVVSSEEEEVLTLADRIIVFIDGRTDGRAHSSSGLTTQALRRLALAHEPVVAAAS